VFVFTHGTLTLCRSLNRNIITATTSNFGQFHDHGTREAKVSGSWTTTGVTMQTFDDLGRRTNIRHADSSNRTIGEYGYSYIYDDAGHMIRIAILLFNLSAFRVVGE
jgi:hypothetical protein